MEWSGADWCIRIPVGLVHTYQIYSSRGCRAMGFACFWCQSHAVTEYMQDSLVTQYIWHQVHLFTKYLQDSLVIVVYRADLFLERLLHLLCYGLCLFLVADARGYRILAIFFGHRVHIRSFAGCHGGQTRSQCLLRPGRRCNVCCMLRSPCCNVCCGRWPGCNVCCMPEDSGAQAHQLELRPPKLSIERAGKRSCPPAQRVMFVTQLHMRCLSH